MMMQPEITTTIIIIIINIIVQNSRYTEPQQMSHRTKAESSKFWYSWYPSSLSFPCICPLIVIILYFCNFIHFSKNNFIKFFFFFWFQPPWLSQWKVYMIVSYFFMFMWYFFYVELLWLKYITLSIFQPCNQLIYVFVFFFYVRPGSPPLPQIHTQPN